MPPLIGDAVGLGELGVGVGVGVGVVFTQRLTQGVAVGEGAAVGLAVGLGDDLAAATPEAPTSSIAKTPGSNAAAARPRGRQREVIPANTFAFIDLIRLWS
jgi:hypothetical protein